MTRFVLLDTGEELNEGNWRALAVWGATVRVRLLDPSPPLRERQVVRVVPLAEDLPRPRSLVLLRSSDAFRLGFLGVGSGASREDILGRVVAIERDSSILSLERGLLALVPPRWLPGAVDVLDTLQRLRHPFTPSLYLGSADTCLAGVRAKYDREAEARRYAILALTGLDPLERDMIERHVKPGGRILNIGCAAGREALGFVRAGFQVVGIDMAPRMIEAARANAEREGLNVSFRVQSATDLDEPPGSFDAVYWAGSYQHLPGRSLRVKTLRRIARALASDGVLILLVVYRAPRGLLSRSRLVDILRSVGGTLFGNRRLSEPGDGCMGEVSDASDPREPCFFHDFSSPEEVRAELRVAGLAAEEARGWWVCRPAR